MKFFSLRNLIAQEVRDPITDPQALCALSAGSKAPYELGKGDFTLWANRGTTDHHWISMCEGVSPGLRVGKDNPPVLMHGIILDYDAKLMPDPVGYIRKNCPSAYLPQWLIRTHRDKGRLVWAFEHPMSIASFDHGQAFAIKVDEEIHGLEWLGGRDVRALHNACSTYFEIGKEWTPIEPDKFIPAARLVQWDMEVCRRMTGKSFNVTKTEIPFDVVAKEVIARFPGRWKGEFAIGSHGVRFWDSHADNPCGVTVTEWGCKVYTPHDKPFMRWQDIPGLEDLVAKYSETQLDAIAAKSAYDGRTFFVKMESGFWRPESASDYAQALRTLGFDNHKERGMKCGKIDEIEYYVKNRCRVDKGLPFIFFPPGRMTWNGKVILNTSTVRPIQPAEAPLDAPGAKWEEAGNGFPFLHGLLSTFFRLKNPDGTSMSVTEARKLPPDPQLEYLLSWLSYFYTNSLNYHPCPGQALVLAGNVEKGKTFFAVNVLRKLMGAAMDGSNYLVKDEQWSDEIAEAPIVNVDDEIATADPRLTQNFSAKLKKLVASPNVRFNKKYGETGQVTWYGRPIVTCNTDAASLSIIPDMDMNTMDKFSLLRLGNMQGPIFAKAAENEAMLIREVPHLARFLMDYQIPGHLVNEKRPRYGIISFHHPTLIDASNDHGIMPTVVDIATTALAGWAQGRKDHNNEWRGTPLELWALMETIYPTQMRSINERRLAGALGALVKRGYPITKEPKAKGHGGYSGHRYIIPLDFASRAGEISKPIMDGEDYDIAARHP